MWKAKLIIINIFLKECKYVKARHSMYLFLIPMQQDLGLDYDRPPAWHKSSLGLLLSVVQQALNC